MENEIWKVGELAQAAGVSVRALHHYDRIGILSPHARDESGHRIYSTEDVERLYLIRALKALGVPLKDVSGHLEQGVGLSEVLGRHLDRVESSLVALHEMKGRLTALLTATDDPLGPSPKMLIETMERMTMHENYYSPEQLEQLKERREQLGEAAIKGYERDWVVLIEEVKAEKEKGTDPSSPRMAELATRWRDLLAAFTGGDAGITRSLGTMYQEEGPEKASRGMLDADLMSYMGKALGKLPPA